MLNTLTTTQQSSDHKITKSPQAEIIIDVLRKMEPEATHCFTIIAAHEFFWSRYYIRGFPQVQDILNPGQIGSQESAPVNAGVWRALILRFVYPPTCVDLRASPRGTFCTVWPPNASRHKLIASQLYMRALRLAWTSEPTCESVWPPFASSLPGFANLRRLASPFRPGLKVLTTIEPFLVS